MEGLDAGDQPRGYLGLESPLLALVVIRAQENYNFGCANKKDMETLLINSYFSHKLSMRPGARFVKASSPNFTTLYPSIQRPGVNRHSSAEED